MLMSKPTILFFLSVPLSLASTILHNRQNGETFRTSNAYPSTEDVTSIISQVRGEGGDCKNTNGTGYGIFWHTIDDGQSLDDHFSKKCGIPPKYMA